MDTKMNDLFLALVDQEEKEDIYQDLSTIIINTINVITSEDDEYDGSKETHNKYYIDNFKVLMKLIEQKMNNPEHIDKLIEGCIDMKQQYLKYRKDNMYLN